MAENIFLGELPARWGGVVDWRALADRTSKLLLDLGMALDPRAPVGRLGLAQRQMVEIAKALAPASAGASAGMPGEAKAPATQGGDAKILVGRADVPPDQPAK